MRTLWDTRCIKGKKDMNKRKLIGLMAMFIALGMLIMLFLRNDLVGIIIIALLLFVGYNCYDCC